MILDNYIRRTNMFSLVFLISFGILMNVSASSVEGLNLYGDNFYFIKRHLTAIIIGVVAFNIIKKLNQDTILDFSFFLIVSVTVVLFLVLTYGIVVGGSRRWIDIGIVNLQPSELAKPIIILWVAKILSNELSKLPEFTVLTRAVALPFLCAFLVLLEPDYGTFATLCVIVVAQIFMSRVKIIYPTSIVALSLLPLISLARAESYRMVRIKTWLDGKCDAGVDLLGDCYQLNQSRIAISSGGLFGLGPGTSRARWGSLPNSYSDFISSIIGEEYGFFGLFLIILGFFILITTTFLMGLNTNNEFKKLYCFGIAAWVLFQTVVNLGGAVGIVPITGMVLPFVSYGSSAMVSIFVGFGVMYSINDE